MKKKIVENGIKKQGHINYHAPTDQIISDRLRMSQMSTKRNKQQQITLLTLTVILASVNQINTAPSGPVKSTSKDYYLTRAWGESSIPFTVIYSNYARSKVQQKTTTTTAPIHRRKNATKKLSPLPNLFVSNGWGPLG
ncbi:hypothetical protein Bhyg_00944 [Pseudolycoriella hygida]|uniref:Uncharacterized protein n=1 Tax=Pseudolycoriella hygida TaxID=35572 RepID=A0A9Q0N8L6_9DIPT|nr:hypothetical protein Bhyg_00944 [Pseudolycoriella hygida]